MDWSLVFSCITTVVSIAALSMAILSRYDSKKANRLADNANNIAGNALTIAAEANELVVKTNNLAEHANSISQRALLASEDKLIYQWRVHIEDDSRTAVLINDCAHEARDVSVIVTDKDGAICRNATKRVAPFDQVPLDLTTLLNEHFDEVNRNPSSPAYSEGGFFFSGSAGKVVETPFKVHITWKTINEVPRDCLLKETLCHRDNYGTIEQC